MTQDQKENFRLKAEVLFIANPATREAMQMLTPAHEASEGDLVMITRNYSTTDKPDHIPDPMDTQAWRMEKSRLMPVKLCAMEPSERARAALPYALASETDGTTDVVLRAKRLLRQEGTANLMLAFLPGAAVVVRWIHDLALFEREGEEAQAFLERNFQPFLEASLSNHERIDALAGLETVLSDLATWGSVERHFGSPDGAPPAPRKVQVTI